MTLVDILTRATGKAVVLDGNTPVFFSDSTPVSSKVVKAGEAKLAQLEAEAANREKMEELNDPMVRLRALEMAMLDLIGDGGVA